MLDIIEIRKDFPILKEMIHNHPLIYFDNAATSQKPYPVMLAMNDYYLQDNANVHRGIHTLSNRATKALEEGRNSVASFIGCIDSKQIVFTYNDTDSINLIVNGYAEYNLVEGDSVLVSRMEHHSNFVAWQQLCKRKKCTFKIVELDSQGQLDMEDLKNKLTPDVKIVSISQMSNVTGIITQSKQIIELSHANGSVVVLDGAQGIIYSKMDVEDLDCDFYCFSAHKLYSMMGLGVLYGKKELLEKTVPFRYGGEMVETVDDYDSTFSPLPYKLEAGTPNVGAVVSLHAAIDYLNTLGLDEIHNSEKELFDYAYKKMSNIKGLHIYGKSKNQSGIISFTVDGFNSFDLAMFLDGYGIAVRSGTHCAQPILKQFKVSGTIRVSFSFYNTKEEVDYFIDSIEKIKKILVRNNG